MVLKNKLKVPEKNGTIIFFHSEYIPEQY